MKRYFLTFLLLFTCIALFGQSVRQEFITHPDYRYGVYRPYPTEFGQLTPVPSGYKPFYISHYGRHGSRYFLSNREFNSVLNRLADAAKQNGLTEKGNYIYKFFCDAEPICGGRGGDLTPLGYTQHAQIAGRMYSNYISIFKSNPRITAISSISNRVVASMTAFTNQLCKCNPKLNLNIDLGNKYLGITYPYTHTYDREFVNQTEKYRYPKAEWSAQWDEFRDKNLNCDRVIGSLFKDWYITNIDNKFDLVRNLWYCGIDFPNTPIESTYVNELFTAEEMYNLFRLENALFYYHKANTGVADNMLVKQITPLLKDIIDKGNKAIKNDLPAVDLRFGHDGCILALLALMEVKDWGERAENIEDIERVCKIYNIPMASNIQMIFYKGSGKSDVLIKMIFNEDTELRLPLPSDKEPYYYWADFVKKYEKIVKENEEFIRH